jgi:hypothetical protein
MLRSPAAAYSACAGRACATAAHTFAGVAGVSHGECGGAPERIVNGVHHCWAGVDGARILDGKAHAHIRIRAGKSLAPIVPARAETE